MARKNLSRRLFLELFLFAVAAALVIATIITAVCYQTYERDMSDSLLDRTEAVAASLDAVDIDYRVRDLGALAVSDVRSTLVDADGTCSTIPKPTPPRWKTITGGPK